MTRLSGLTEFLVCLCVIFHVTPSRGEDESKEPPLTYEVKLGDQLLLVQEGESAEFKGTFTDPKVTFTPQPDRVFPYQGISFKYPRSFSYEVELTNPNAKQWTLSGNDVKIMVFSLQGRHTTTEFADGLLEIFGRDKSQITNVKAEIVLGTETLKGTTLQWTAVASKLESHVYLIPSEGPHTKLIIFQYMLDKDGNQSKETRETFAQIKKSFALMP